MTTVVHLLSAGAVKGLVLALQPDFKRAHDVRFECHFGAVGAMRDRLITNDACDLIILTAAMIAKLIDEGLVASDTAAKIGDVETGIAVPAVTNVAGVTAMPRIGNADALRSALTDARRIYLPDPEKATAGIHFAKVLQQLGILDAVRGRLEPYPNGATAMHELAARAPAGSIGCTQVTEINYSEGVTLVGALPPEFSLKTTYSVGVCVNGSQPRLARMFAALLAGPESASLRRQGGFL